MELPRWRRTKSHSHFDAALGQRPRCAGPCRFGRRRARPSTILAGCPSSCRRTVADCAWGLSATAHAIECLETAQPIAAAKGTRLCRLSAATLDASATTSLAGDAISPDEHAAITELNLNHDFAIFP